MISNQLVLELSYLALFFVVLILSFLWLLVERRNEILWHIYLPEKASLLERCKRFMAAFFRVSRLFFLHGNLLPVLKSVEHLQQDNEDAKEGLTHDNSQKDTVQKDTVQKDNASNESDNKEDVLKASVANDTHNSDTTDNKTEQFSSDQDASNESKTSDTGADKAQEDETALKEQSNTSDTVTDKSTSTTPKQIIIQQQNAAIVMAEGMSQLQKPILLRYMTLVTVAFITVFASFLFFPVSEQPPAIISYLGVFFVFCGGLLVSTLLLMVSEPQRSGAFDNKTIDKNVTMRTSAYRDRIVTTLLLWVVILINLVAMGYQNHSFDLILMTVSQQNGQWHVLSQVLGVASFLGAVMCLHVVIQGNDQHTPDELPPVLFNHVTHLITQYAVRILLLCLMLFGYFGGYHLALTGQAPDLACFVMKLVVMVVLYAWLQPRVMGVLQYKFSGGDTTQNMLRVSWFVLLPIAIVNMALQLFVL